MKVHSAVAQLSKAISEAIGVEWNWFSIAHSAAKGAGLRGADVAAVASQVMGTILLELQKTEGKLYQRFHSAETVNESRRIFYVAARNRSRHAADKLRSSRRIKSVSTNVELMNLSLESKEAAPTSTRMSDLLEYLKQELLQMQQEAAGNKAERDRLGLAVQVAQIRLENAPEYVGLRVLDGIFNGENGYPKISKGRLYRILNDIRRACARMGERFDDPVLKRAAA